MWIRTLGLSDPSLNTQIIPKHKQLTDKHIASYALDSLRKGKKKIHQNAEN